MQVKPNKRVIDSSACAAIYANVIAHWLTIVIYTLDPVSNLQQSIDDKNWYVDNVHRKLARIVRAIHITIKCAINDI